MVEAQRLLLFPSTVIAQHVQPIDRNYERGKVPRNRNISACIHDLADQQMLIPQMEWLNYILMTSFSQNVFLLH